MDDLNPDALGDSQVHFEIHEDPNSPNDTNITAELAKQHSSRLAEGVAIPLVTSQMHNQRASQVENTIEGQANQNNADITFHASHNPERKLVRVVKQPEFPKPVITKDDDRNATAYPVSESEEVSRLKTELEAAKYYIAQMDAELSRAKSIDHSIDPAPNLSMYGNIGVQYMPNKSSSKMDGCPVDVCSSTLDVSIGSSENLLTSATDVTRQQRADGQNASRAATTPLKHRSENTVAWTLKQLLDWQTAHADHPDTSTQHTPSSESPRLLRAQTENATLLGGAYTTSTGVDPWEARFRVTSLDALSRSESEIDSYLEPQNARSAGLSSRTEFSSKSASIPFDTLALAPIATPYIHHNTNVPFQTPSRGHICGSNMYPSPWNPQPHLIGGNPAFIPPAEPTNYRRLLDRNMSCNWKHIVDKIICSNDQQASIFLQQKLKIATMEQKRDIIQAIIEQAYPLMINRFGNFLVQRCFEHGTTEQVKAIANVIRGNVLNLSMDPFGCHVIQKAFDVVSEDYKARMVHELLRRIPETVIHRYACHVWQKLFELRWSDSPPQIMKNVNEALRGMWHEVALGETGSLVVQNIFENCLEEDKRLCINEVLASIDIISHGQFGNWCIQHICEHGAPADKSRAIDHILHFAAEYSTDQYASKVVEKCLKVSGVEFLNHYLGRICEGRIDRPRMPLIDIAGDQYGNYLIQYILMNANPQHRDIVTSHIRKHMVSLRGSKFGSRVAMACSNPASATRPGPAIGLGSTSNRFDPHGVFNRAVSGAPYR